MNYPPLYRRINPGFMYWILWTIIYSGKQVFTLLWLSLSLLQLQVFFVESCLIFSEVILQNILQYLLDLPSLQVIPNFSLRETYKNAWLLSSSTHFHLSCFLNGWHHGLDGHESEWTLGDGDGPGGLACCDSWVTKSRTRLSDWAELITMLQSLQMLPKIVIKTQA